MTGGVWVLNLCWCSGGGWSIQFIDVKVDDARPDKEVKDFIGVFEDFLFVVGEEEEQMNRFCIQNC